VRPNRTLIERTRAMLLDASLPLSLWGEAVVAACHVRNRSPISETRAGTPWGLFFGAVPDVSHLRVFGCRVCFHVPRELRTKLDSISYSGVFVGYGGDGHRVLVDGTRKVTGSRDVVFLEEPASRAGLSSSGPAPNRKNAEHDVDVKRKTGVGGDALPVDSSTSEDRFVEGLVPSAVQEQNQSPWPCESDPAEDVLEQPAILPEEPAALPEQPAAEETSADEVDIHQNLPEEPAAPDHPRCR
jgi:hypothetical protein